MSLTFSVQAADPGSKARTGTLGTPHGEIATPAFAPVGTQATVKALDPHDLRELGVEIVLANTYHLVLRPGLPVVSDFGGLHRFMGWDGPILTDSGGFQVFSLGARRQVDADGITFRSHIDGSSQRFTPETVIEAQEQLGADIIMCLDECAVPDDRRYSEEALGRTHAWAERCREAQRRSDQALFGIVQGGVFADLRQKSAKFLASLDLPGYAIGGLSVGESKEEMYHILDITLPLLPADKARYLMGVGAPEDLLEAVSKGVDLFDCVLPTRLARNASVFSERGRLNLRNAMYEREQAPIEPACQCYTCRQFSLAYLRHLFRAEELLAYRLATIHNLHFLLELMRRVRRSITLGTFASFRGQFLAGYRVVSEEVRAAGRAQRSAAAARGRASTGDEGRR